MTIEVVTKEELQKVLDELAHVKQRLAVVEQGGGRKTQREYWTPREAGRRFGIGNDIVYAALADGRLPAEKRPGHGHDFVYRINPDDARTWYAEHVRAGSNQ